MQGKILVVSGPSGCGKSSLINEVLKSQKDLYFSLSCTTREIREGEKDGVNYHYISKEQFEKEIKDGEFLEWAKVHDNYYGTSLKPIYKALNEGKLVILDIDVQGHMIVKDKFKEILTSVFVTTPNKRQLQKRLLHRATDSKETISKRLQNAQKEMSRICEYDYLLINDKFNLALNSFKAIVQAARLKIYNKEIDSFINEWKK